MSRGFGRGESRLLLGDRQIVRVSASRRRLGGVRTVSTTGERSGGPSAVAEATTTATPNTCAQDSEATRTPMR
jgi:hypothetical protein